MLNVTCKHCGSTNTRVLTPLETEENENEEKKETVKCLSCNKEYPYEEAH